ncbi:MAG: S8 family serine peptidase, partial [Methanophagales archaeon]|nr:S8 family serine peptidase [Methanophagales archaeon]
VAIVDLGFEGYEDLLGTELPANVTVRSFRVDGDITGGGLPILDRVHGTACAEVVHDVAPDAELYLVNYKYVYQLEAIIGYLISENVNVVSHSAGHCVGLFDGSDEICKIIDDAVFNHSIIWVNSAGNYAQRHWEGMFTDTDSNGWHEYPCEGGTLGQTINATMGDTVVVWLSWNDTWGYATQDYDLYIYNFENNWRIASKNPQFGYLGQKPVEGGGFVAPYNGTYYIAIGDSGATRPVHFELYAYTHDFGCKVENSSLSVEATPFGAKAVGAVSWEDCSTLHSYSSRGPTNDGREKPDFVGPACVSTQSYLSVGYPFCGTSAATPHIAGAIALELSSK